MPAALRGTATPHGAAAGDRRRVALPAGSQLSILLANVCAACLAVANVSARRTRRLACPPPEPRCARHPTPRPARRAVWTHLHENRCHRGGATCVSADATGALLRFLRIAAPSPP